MTNDNRDMVAETEYYSKLYKIADVDGDGRVSGQEGAAFLRKSGLPDSTLKQVWQLAAKGSGFLTQPEFAVAMRLIAMSQGGKDPNLNDVHNVKVYPRFEGIQVPNQFPAKISEQDLQKYDNLFAAADTNQDNLVDGNEAKAFFSKAQLPVEYLSAIWKLSERDGDGKLNKGEFRICMHLVYWCLQGNQPPSALPQSLIEQANTAVVYTPGSIPAANHKGPSPHIASLVPLSSQSNQSANQNLLTRNDIQPSQPQIQQQKPNLSNQYPQPVGMPVGYAPNMQPGYMVVSQPVMMTHIVAQPMPGYGYPAMQQQPINATISMTTPKPASTTTGAMSTGPASQPKPAATPVAAITAPPSTGNAKELIATSNILGLGTNSSTSSTTSVSHNANNNSHAPQSNNYGQQSYGQTTGQAPSSYGQPTGQTYGQTYGQPTGQAPSSYGQPSGQTYGQPTPSHGQHAPAPYGQPGQHAPANYGQQPQNASYGQPGHGQQSYGQPTGQAPSSYGQPNGHQAPVGYSQPTGQPQTYGQPGHTAAPQTSAAASTGASPFASGSSPFGGPSPFGSTGSPFNLAEIDTGSSSFGSEPATSQTTAPRKWSRPAAPVTSDPFASGNHTPNPGEPQWVAPEGGHQFDQSKHVYQHSMPGTTFEMRANFTAELGNALNKVKKPNQ